jgi:pyruvate/2-oxoglutarate dehydrogenase complex dihydrolipoamide dehydrogenase (E3) component
MHRDVTIMVRSILLRGFDQQIAEQIGEVMERDTIRFIRPAYTTKMERKTEGGPISVSYYNEETKETKIEEFDTVLFAIGRDAVIKDIGLDKAGVRLERGKIVVDDSEQTNVPHIYAIGDCILDKPELTPVAIAAGKLLAARLFGGGRRKMDYINIPTTVFTPLEYGACGYSQEAAEAAFGATNVECYVSRFGVLESAIPFPENLPVPKSGYFIGPNLWARKHTLKLGKEWIGNSLLPHFPLLSFPFHYNHHVVFPLSFFHVCK